MLVRGIADQVVAGKSRFGLFAIAAMAAFFLVLMVFEQAGMPERYGYVLTGMFVISAFAFPGIGARTAAFEDWQFSGRTAAPTILAMSMAALLVPSVFFLGLPGNFFAQSGGSAALLLGPPCGLAIAAILILPFLRKSNAGTPPLYFKARYANAPASIVAMAFFALASFIMLWGQLQIVASISLAVFGLEAGITIALAVLLVSLTVLPGGLNGLIRTNSLAYVLMATAFLVPLVWLSLTTTGIPLPQIAHGPGALVEIVELERQLTGLGLPPLEKATSNALPAMSNLASIVSLTLFLALAFACYPAILSQSQSARQVKTTRPAIAISIVLAAIVTTAMPAAASFAKIAIYNGIFGLTVGEIPDSANWILKFGAKLAPLGAGEPLVTLCSQAVTTLEQAIAACGGNPDYALGPADLRLRGEIISLALPDIALLPSAFTMAVGAALVAAALASANASAFALSSVLVTRAPISGMNRLFIARLGVLCGILAAAWLALYHPASSLDLVFWSLAICAGVLAPAILLAIWSDRMHAIAAIAGMLASGIALATMAGLSIIGPDLLAGSGDEYRLLLPGLAELPLPIPAGLCAIAAGTVVAALIAWLLPRKPDTLLLESLRVPDAPVAG